MYMYTYISEGNKFRVILLPIIEKQAVIDNTVVNKLFRFIVAAAYGLSSSGAIQNNIPCDQCNKNKLLISQRLVLCIFIKENSPRFRCLRTSSTELSMQIEVKPEFRPIFAPNTCGLHSPLGGLLYLHPIF